MSIGERLKFVRKEKNLNQTEFGERIGLSQTTIGLFESNRRPITDRTLTQICQAFNINESWLKTGNGDVYCQTQENILNNPSLDATDREILNSYIRMTPSQRQFIKSWIKNIAATINDVPNNISNNHNNSDDIAKNDEELKHRKKIIETEYLAEKKGTTSSAFTSINGTKKHA